jgi:hypothetical protein
MRWQDYRYVAGALIISNERAARGARRQNRALALRVAFSDRLVSD